MDTPAGGHRANIAIILGILGIAGAAWNGSNGVFQAGKTYQEFQGRMATLEAQFDQAEADRVQRRQDNAAALASISTRISGVESDVRSSGLTTDRNTTAIGALQSQQNSLALMIERLTEAINALAQQQGIQTEILKRVEAEIARSSGSIAQERNQKD